MLTDNMRKMTLGRQTVQGRKCNTDCWRYGTSLLKHKSITTL